MNGELKPIRWIGTSPRDLRSFPRAVRVDIGHALFTAQEGKTDPAAKPLKGFGARPRARNCSFAPRQCVARRLYGGFSGCHLCFARISEEVHEGHRYTEEGD